MVRPIIKWRTIRGYPDYQINNLGEVRKILKTEPVDWTYNKNKYPGVRIKKEDGSSIWMCVHQIVGRLFVRKPPGLKEPTLDHLNMDKNDPSEFNLEWVEREENERRAREIQKINPIPRTNRTSRKRKSKKR